MNITELKGEKTVAALAKRLLAQSSRAGAKTSEREMEGALLRLNPHLRQIGKLEKGTPVVVPGDFALAANESAKPMSGIAGELLRQGETAVTGLQAALKESVTQFAEQTDQMQAWLKSDQAREVLHRSPELKAVFSTAASEAKSAVKEQAAALAAEEKALDKLRSELADFRGAQPGDS